MSLKNPPIARATMLIRKPVEKVFNAFVDPAVTTKFWFSRSSGPLRAGETVTWYWDHYGFSADVHLTVLEANRRIDIEWPTPVEWLPYGCKRLRRPRRSLSRVCSRRTTAAPLMPRP